uniref:Putative multicomponent Na+:H+ antiporter subunit B n=1 Tax=Cyanothece sp. (strain PCC 7425 / ATCC 29141) TaxID=395961 RepID=B8HRK1_CYAP4
MDSYIYMITALLPLAAVMVMFQTNPYHALVMRGILGAVAALTYSVLGAPDVALTEALVGTLLAVLLYAVAVRSSLVLRLGVLKTDLEAKLDPQSERGSKLQQLYETVQSAVKKHYLHVELVPYPNALDLDQALLDKDVHAICTPVYETTEPDRSPVELPPPYRITTRLPRLYEIMETKLGSALTHLCPQPTPNPGEVH